MLTNQNLVHLETTATHTKFYYSLYALLREYAQKEFIIHKVILEEVSKRKQAGEKNLAIERNTMGWLDH